MASSIFNNSSNLRSKFIRGNATTGTTLKGSTGLYVATFNIVNLSGIPLGKIKGFLPTTIQDTQYYDWVNYVGQYGSDVGLGSTASSRELHLEGYVIYED